MILESTKAMELVVPPALLAVDLDTIVFLVVVSVSLLGRLFGKKDPEGAGELIEGDDWNEKEARPSARGTTGRQVLDWEAEMRRLLEGRDPEPEPVEAPPPLPAPAIVRVPAPAPQFEARPVNAFANADEAFRKARELKAKAAAQMAAVGKLPTAKNARKGHRRSPAARAVIGQLRRSGTARQAVIASTILGAPKGLD
ncbi:MAG: hypothetical protein ISQ14_07540 [Verrucomicrobiae bacterium]|jgi:hypothetical protein|nr:hypothetical protein [Verrucomicrobiae bacterium]